MKIIELETPLEGTHYTVFRYVDFGDIYGNRWRVEDGTWHDGDVVTRNCIRTVRMVENKRGEYGRQPFGAPILNQDALVKELEAKKLLMENWSNENC